MRRFLLAPPFQTRSAATADVLHILSSSKNVRMKLFFIFAFQNLKQTAGFVGSKIWNKFVLTVYTCR